LKSSASLADAIARQSWDGHHTYVLATSVMATSASALGVALPFNVYTALSASLGALLGPVGWAAVGITGLLGLRATRGRIEARNRVRLLAVITHLVAIDLRVKENIRLATDGQPGSAEVIDKLQDEVEELWSLISGLETDIDTKSDESDALESQNAVLIGKISELEQQLELARRRKGYTYPVEEDREVPLSSHGSHQSIWKGAVRSLDDLPQADRRLLAALMKHVSVQRIQLGTYDGTNPRPRKPPVLMLRRHGEGRLIGRLYTKARRKNCCDVTVVVEKGSESSVLHYAAEEGLLRSTGGR
jgi:hypothetical protein